MWKAALIWAAFIAVLIAVHLSREHPRPEPINGTTFQK